MVDSRYCDTLRTIAPTMKAIHFIKLLVAATSPFLLANCTVSSPAKRAEKRPAAFHALPAAHQKMALTGQITEGMNRDAVWVAWGPAGRILEASENGARYEIWRYHGMQPVMQRSVSVGFGFSTFPRRGHGFYADPFMGFDAVPDYIPFTSAEVKFRNGLVKSWQRIAN